MDRHPTETKILDEAIRIIETSGEASLRVHDIETAVGVTAPSIYHFFGSREGLVAEAQAERLLRSFQRFDPVIEEAVASVTSRESAREAVRVLLTLIYDPSRTVERQRRLFAIGSAEGRPELAKRVNEITRFYLNETTERLRPLQERGVIRPELDLEAFTYWFAGQILGRVYVEVGAESTLFPQWDEISIDAVVYLLLGPE